MLRMKDFCFNFLTLGDFIASGKSIKCFKLTLTSLLIVFIDFLRQIYLPSGEPCMLAYCTR